MFYTSLFYFCYTHSVISVYDNIQINFALAFFQYEKEHLNKLRTNISCPHVEVFTQKHLIKCCVLFIYVYNKGLSFTVQC